MTEDLDVSRIFHKAVCYRRLESVEVILLLVLRFREYFDTLRKDLIEGNMIHFGYWAKTFYRKQSKCKTYRSELLDIVNEELAYCKSRNRL